MARGAPGPDLFAAAVEERLASRAPLAARLRPRSLDEVVGQQHLLGPGKPLRVLIESDRLSSLVLWGPPGIGQDHHRASSIAGATAKAFETPLGRVSAGVKDVREVAERARARLGERGQGTILFLDEVHRFSRAQQDVLLPFVEEGLLVLVGATTENPFFSLTGPLLSRSTLFRLEPLGDDELGDARRPRARPTPNAASVDEPATIDDDALRASRRPQRRRRAPPPHRARGRARAHRRRRPRRRSRSTTRKPRSRCAACSYGDDEHYDIISAFIKSIRGSDPDAGLYWLARMLEAGEDPRFIARRLVILASEDVGLADPQRARSSPTPRRARSSTSGCPRPALNLAHAVIHLALAPKSNSVEASLLGAASAAVRDRRRRARCRCTCATRTTGARRRWATARATSILTTRRRAGCRRSTCRPRWRASGSTGRARTAPSPDRTSSWSAAPSGERSERRRTTKRGDDVGR